MKNKNTQNYIIFDINSSSIGVLVFKAIFDTLLKKNIYHEVFSFREEITKGQTIDIETIFFRSLKSFESVAKKAHKYSGADIADIYINIAAPWISSQKRVIHYKKDKEFIFTKELADSLIDKEIKEPLFHTHDFKEHKDISLIERRTIDIFLNGYSSKNPYGKKIKDVDIYSLVSVMSTKTKKEFSHIVEKTFHQEAQFFSNSFMIYQSLLKLFPHENNITSIDISGEITEINIIINDHLKKIGTIPVGSQNIIRKLADNLNIPYVKAKALIIMYQDNKIEDTYRKIVEKAMKNAFMSWFKSLYHFFDIISLEYIIPDTISLLTPPYMQVWLGEQILKTEELAEHIHAHKNISILDFKMLWRSTQKKNFEQIKDDNLALCVEFVSNFLLKEKQK